MDLRYVAKEKMLNLLGYERCLGLSKSNLKKKGKGTIAIKQML
jgi:hypothetical protein